MSLITGPEWRFVQSTKGLAMWGVTSGAAMGRRRTEPRLGGSVPRQGGGI
jgi:hypothetical protein